MEEQYMAMIRKHIVFSGYVQGVGFRWRAAKAAGMHNVALTTTFGREELETTVSPEYICDDIFDIIKLIYQYNTKQG